MRESEPIGNPAAKVTSLVSVAPSPGATLSLARDITLIGSGSGVRLRLRSAAVGHCHAAILNGDGGLYLRDLSARSNLYVNERLTREAPLHADDRLQVGPFVFTVRQGPATESPTISATPNAVLHGQDDVMSSISGRTLLIGRTSHCDLRIGSTEVSAAHALIFALGGGHQIRDLDSRTGTRVNGQTIRQVPLAAGDLIEIGPAQLRYLPTTRPPQEGDPISAPNQTPQAIVLPTAGGGGTLDSFAELSEPPILLPRPEPDREIELLAALDESLLPEKLDAIISFKGLDSGLDGRPWRVTTVTEPPDLAGVTLTYNGSADLPVNAGRYRVVAELDHPSFVAPPATAALVIRRARQSIAIAPIPQCVYGDPPFTLSAIASSGLPIHFAAAGALRVVGDRGTIVSAGTAWVTATQSGGANFEPASETLTFVVGPTPLTCATDDLEPQPGVPTSPPLEQLLSAQANIDLAAHPIDPTNARVAPDLNEILSVQDDSTPTSRATDPSAPASIAPTPPPASSPPGPMNGKGRAETARRRPAEPNAPTAVEPLHGDSMLKLLPAVFGMGSFEQEMQSIKTAARTEPAPAATEAAVGLPEDQLRPTGKEPRRGWIGRLVNRVKRPAGGET